MSGEHEGREGRPAAAGRVVRGLVEGAVLLAALSVMFLTAREQSAKKPLWMDELVTFAEATDPSLANVLSAVAHMDGNPPLYPLFMREWTGAFGADELMLRLPSAIGLAVAMLVCWALTRRLFGFWPATLASFTVFLTPHDVLVHYSEARYYGQFLLLTSLVMAAYSRLARVERPGAPLLVLNVLLNAALVMTHTFGGLYAACALAVLAGRDLRAGRRRWRVWASYVAGWTVWLPWIPSFLQQRELGRPHGWLTLPSLDGVVDAYNYGLNDSLPVLVLLVAGAAAALGRSTSRPERPDAGALVALALAFVLVPPLVTLAASHLVVPVFLPRYLLPGLLGFLVLIAALLHRAGLDGARGVSSRLLLLGALIFALSTPLRMILATRAPFDGAVADEIARLYEDGIPVVTEDPQLYLPLHHYQSKENTWMVVDRESALDPKASPTAVNNDHLMRAMARHYPEHNVIEGADLLARYDRFYLLEIDYYRWSERALRGNLAWRLEHVTLNAFRAERR